MRARRTLTRSGRGKSSWPRACSSSPIRCTMHRSRRKRSTWTTTSSRCSSSNSQMQLEDAREPTLEGSAARQIPSSSSESRQQNRFVGTMKDIMQVLKNNLIWRLLPLDQHLALMCDLPLRVEQHSKMAHLVSQEVSMSRAKQALRLPSSPCWPVVTRS